MLRIPTSITRPGDGELKATRSAQYPLVSDAAITTTSTRIDDGVRHARYGRRAEGRGDDSLLTDNGIDAPAAQQCTQVDGTRGTGPAREHCPKRTT
jgi:hypothetical protein